MVQIIRSSTEDVIAIMAEMKQLAAVLPVRNLADAMGHYRSLGFSVRPYEGEALYALADRDGVHLHLARVRELDPPANVCSVYLRGRTQTPSTRSGWKATSEVGSYRHRTRITDYEKDRTSIPTATC